MRTSKQVGGPPVPWGPRRARRSRLQSMLNVPSTDIPGSVAQAKRLEAARCQILRAAIPDMAAVALIPAIKEAVRSPWWRTSTSTTSWPWSPWPPGWIRCASTPAISARTAGCGPWPRPAGRRACPSGWGSTPARWKSTSWQNRGIRRPTPRPWWRAPSTTCPSWRNSTSPISWSPSRPPR